jgi:hypothetical protein
MQETPKKNSTTTTKHSRKTTTGEMRFATHDAIAVRAHELFVSSGCQTGRDLEFWLEAEHQLREELNR